MSLEIPRAYHRFDESCWYLTQVLKPAVQDLPPEPLELAIKLKLAVLAEDAGDGRRSTPCGQAVAYLRFDRSLRPLTEFTRQVLSSVSFTVRSLEDLAHLRGQIGECRFGLGDPFTGYQPVVAWRPAEVAAEALGAIALGDCEPPSCLFRLSGNHFHLRWGAGDKHETGTFGACAGLRLTQRLLQRPHRPVDTLELVNESGEPTICSPADRHDVSDRRALAEVAREIGELTTMIERARTEEPTLLPIYEGERQQLRDYLDQARDDRGRPRRLDAGDPAEAARKTIVNDCQRAWQRLANHRMPGLASFLKATMRLGREGCLYQPPTPAPDWVF